MTTVIATAAEKANKTLGTNIATLQKLVTELSDTHAVLENTTEQVQIKEAQLENLGKELDYRSREYAAELALKIRENEQGTLTELLEKYRMAKVSEEDLAILRKNLEQAKMDNDVAIQAAVKAEASALHASYRNTLATAEADHRVAMAEAEANAKAKDSQIAFLSAQVTQLQAQVEADRAARIEIARAESGRQGVVVNTSSK